MICKKLRAGTYCIPNFSGDEEEACKAVLTTKNNMGLAPLHTAAMYNSVAVMEAIMELGATDINTLDPWVRIVIISYWFFLRPLYV